MIVYRIGSRRWIDDLTGYGASLYGGRWNSQGNYMLYTSTNVALAVLEVVVNTSPRFLPKDYALLSLSIPNDTAFNDVAEERLPDDWRTNSGHAITREIGDSFLHDKDYPAMRVPSAIVVLEKNILLNPEHDFFTKAVVENIQPFDFDRRLFAP